MRIEAHSILLHESSYLLAIAFSAVQARHGAAVGNPLGSVWAWHYPALPWQVSALSSDSQNLTDVWGRFVSFCV